MSTYAYVFDGIVWEIVTPPNDESGSQMPLTDLYTPAYISTCVDITHVTPQPKVGWAYNGSAFTNPA
ncbi:hypothetical protein KDW37_29490 [Burkholderia cenocepacia]|uniref:hypothetical protein n=1 Tax=Burkholderia cenocepacia TaxID=95486 RepID=UPI001B9B0F32|nr:hypothetical protein [Burkholderia cenocepacia]MBR8434900.1 hypothetical protein [Burkholderia cenocepacia]